MPWDVEANAPLAHLLYRRLIVERNPSIQDVRRRTAIPESTLKGWRHGSSPLPAWAVPVLGAASGDLRFWAELAGADVVGAVVSRAPTAETADELRAEGLTLAADAGAAVATLRDALEDNTIDAVERRELVNALNRVLRDAQRLTLAVVEE